MHAARRKPARIGVILVGLGIALFLLGLYFAPSHAYSLQAPFRALGEPTIGVIVAKDTRTRTYEAGGQDPRERSYRERVITVELPNEAGRKVEIQHLVLRRDYERLAVGDEVAVTLIRGEAARTALPRGPFYLLTSSVEAGPADLLGWAFDGRPASGKAIATLIPGIVLLLIGGALLLGRRKQATDTPAKQRELLFDWQPIDRDEPISADYGDNANFHVTPHAQPYNRNTVGALFRMHPLPDGFVTTWRSFCVARNRDGSLRWRLEGWGKYLAVSPNGRLLAITREGKPTLAIVDAGTGAIRLETEPLARYLWQPTWTADGERIVVIGDEELIVLDRSGVVLRRINEFPGDVPHPVLASLLTMPDGRLLISHPNAKLLLVYDEINDSLTAVEEKYANNLFLAPSGKFVWSGATGGAYSSAVPSLEPAGWFRMPGKLGIRAADQADDFSYIQFQPIPRPSDDDKLVLINDRTGQLWLVSAGKGTAYHRWPREVVDAVEDTLWVAGDAFLVASNDYRIRKLSFYSERPEFEVSDRPRSR